MPFTVSLPFWSQGQYIAVTQEPGDGTHTGYLKNSWDFALPFGHEVLAIADGVIVDIRETIPDGDAYQMTQDETWGSGAIGNIVTIRHEQDGKVFYSTYMHLRENSVPVEIGQTVAEGQVIGQVGHTGVRTGSHLHLQVGTSLLWFGSTNYGWPDGTDNGEPQLIADASDLYSSADILFFEGYGTDLPSYVVGPPPAEQFPDIIAENFTTSSTVVKAGDFLDFTWQITNIGAGDQTTLGYAGIYLSTDSTIDLTDRLLYEETFDFLNAGWTDYEFRYGVWIPSNLAPGTYWIGVYADNRQTVTESNGGNNVSNVIQITITAPSPTTDPDYDFNGDGYSDILWRNLSTGTLGTWEMGPGGYVWNSFGSVNADWDVVAIGDFDGNGSSDIFWRNKISGAVGTWEMWNGNPYWTGLGTVGASWEVVGSGDYDGNGDDDILWRDTTTGTVGYWAMTNGSPAWVGLGAISLDWRIVGSGDFDGDGIDEFIWRNSVSGGIGTWEMNGGNPVWRSYGTVGTGWEIAAIGDFDGNGDEDIFWRNSLTGAVGSWEMVNGSPYWNSHGTVGSSWSVEGTGDYNGDGTDDILWRDSTTGTVGYWAMTNGEPSWHSLGQIALEWEII